MLVFLAMLGCANNDLELKVPEGEISGIIPIKLNGSVDHLSLFIDGYCVAQKDGSELSFVWDSNTVEDGPHVIRGQGDTDLNIEVVVDVRAGAHDQRPPLVTLITPQTGPAAFPIRVSFLIEEDQKLESVEILDNQTILAVLLPEPPWEAEFYELPPGEHHLIVQAIDMAGNLGQDSVEIRTE